MDEKRKLEKNGIEVGGWGVWKRVESGVERGVRGIWEYDGGTPGVYGNFWEIAGLVEISEKILGIFRENSGKFPEIMGDTTRGVQHGIT